MGLPDDKPQALAHEGIVDCLWAVIAHEGGIVAVDIAGQTLPLVTYAPKVSRTFALMLPMLAKRGGRRVYLVRATGAYVEAVAEP